MWRSNVRRVLNSCETARNELRLEPADRQPTLKQLHLQIRAQRPQRLISLVAHDVLTGVGDYAHVKGALACRSTAAAS